MKRRNVLNESDVLADQDGHANVAYLRARIAELEAELKSAREASGQLEELFNSIRDSLETAKPRPIVYKPTVKSSSPCWHVLHLTDLHFGAVVNKDEVEGFNEYSPDVFYARMEKLVNSIVNKTNVQRSGYLVPRLHILGTGDYISGDIHHELQVTNAFPSPRQAVLCGYAIGEMIAEFARHFSEVTADFITLDNHGRLTKRHQCAEGGFNNLSYVTCEIAAHYVRNLPNVKIRVHAKPTALVAIGPERYLIFHGHQIRGWAGKPYYGFDRRVAMEAVKRMGVPENSFTKLVFGHFHHAFNGDYWMMGGSFSGTDAYDHSCGRFARPHQTSWFVHPVHGEFDWTRWWL